jgi:hypothetical protein
MKFGTIAALVATTNAHWGHHHKHHKWYPDHVKGDLGHHPVYHWVKSFFEPAEQAESKQCPNLVHDDWLTHHWKFKQAIYTNVIQGFYQDRIENEVSDKCFDVSSLKKLDGIFAIGEKLRTGDFFAITLEEHKAAVDNVIELIYQTIEDCRFVVPIQDALHWCRDNTDKCVHKHDLIERL